MMFICISKHFGSCLICFSGQWLLVQSGPGMQCPLLYLCFCLGVAVALRSLVRELALSGRKMLANEAFQHGLVSRSFQAKEAMMAEALSLAKTIASKSPVATLGIKEFLNYSRDHSVSDSLEYAITWNMGMLQGGDLAMATASMVQKSVPEYDNLPSAPSAGELKQSKL